MSKLFRNIVIVFAVLTVVFGVVTALDWSLTYHWKWGALLLVFVVMRVFNIRRNYRWFQRWHENDKKRAAESKWIGRD
jgi:hypothetical protein